MICSLHLCLPEYYYTRKDVSKLKAKLTNVSTSVSEYGMTTETKGNLENYQVRILDDRIYFNGSIGKYYHGNNVVSLTKDDLKEALKKLKKTTGLQIYKADVCRIDIAMNIVLPHKFKSYTPFLENTPDYLVGRDKFGGMRYKTRQGNIEFVFYDKLRELRNRDELTYNLTKGYVGKGCMMRIEARIVKTARKTLLPKASKLMAVHLLSETVHRRLIWVWKKHYNKIPKSKSPRLRFDVSGLKELKDILATYALHTIGLKDVLTDIEEMARQGEWSAKKKSTVRRGIKDLHQDEFLGKTSHYIKEMEEAVRENEEMREWVAAWG